MGSTRLASPTSTADTSYNSVLSSVLLVGDPLRFNLGTPAEVWSSMRRTWEYSPSSERIIQDITALPRVLKVIIEAKGCVVHDEFFRSGRRALDAVGRIDGKARTLAHAPRKRQRRDTMEARPYHPSLECCRSKFKSGELEWN